MRRSTLSIDIVVSLILRESLGTRWPRNQANEHPVQLAALGVFLRPLKAERTPQIVVIIIAYFLLSKLQ